VETERAALNSQCHTIRERSARVFASEAKAVRLVTAYAKERAGLMEKRALPTLEPIMLSFIADINDTITLAAALQSEVQSLVEKREWCEVLVTKCGGLASELKNRASRVPAFDSDWRAEKAFLLKCVPELEAVAGRGVVV
jgi:hypothetical protein